MVSRTYTVAFEGVEARTVEVQCAVTPGLPSFSIVGLPDKAVSEARDRVRAALSALSIALPSKRLTINLSPADMPKEGSHFDLPIALALLAALGLMIWGQIRDALSHRALGKEAEAAEAEEEDPNLSRGKIALFLALGLIGLPIGADLLVKGATHIALAAGISEAVIGLTLVAIGTSLPELATSLTAAMKGRTDLMMGNVIGSNIFNLLCIIGVAGLIGPIPVPEAMLRFDLWVMLGAAVLMMPFAMRGVAITRGLGLGLTAVYAAYVVVLIV